MTLRYWDPFRELRHMQRTMNGLWKGYPTGGYDGAEVESWAVPLDVIHEGDDIIVRASLPGLDPDDIQVTLEENVLTIKAQTKAERESQEGNYLMKERRTGSFYRTLRLPDSVDTDKARPRYENGVLTISFPKVEAKKAKQLKVEVGKALEGKKS